MNINRGGIEFENAALKSRDGKFRYCWLFFHIKVHSFIFKVRKGQKNEILR